MKFTTAETYGLRAMIYLAQRYGSEQACSLSQIADQENLPLAFLEQIFRDLKKQGLVTSSRGAQGGYYLAKEPARISMLEILEAIGGELSLLECNRDFCSQNACRISPFIQDLQSKIRELLAAASL
ncbi:MAG TPA: Rrf2 family transcriptional regulator, partial [Candidatus Wirthbacteria bacterium]|nr:Rrf2 family transcriptional regulator [Candidatus Wirthbacteria bacterium]